MWTITWIISQQGKDYEWTDNLPHFAMKGECLNLPGVTSHRYNVEKQLSVKILYTVLWTL